MENSRICRYSFQLLTVLLLTNYLSAYEFDADSCVSMNPREKGVETQTDQHNGDHSHHRRNAEHDEEEKHEHEIYKLKIQPNPSPFEIAVERFEFRRNRPFKVTITGAEFNGFMLQARTRGSKTPVGVFENIPANAMGLNCNVSYDTLVHKDTGGKENLTFIWKAPANPPDAIVFMLTAVQNDNYWVHIHSQMVPLSPFPPSLSGCGKTKSCYRQSTVADCPPEKCDYFITTEVLNATNEIEMIIGGTVKERDGFVGIGFTMDNARLTNMDINACVKYNDIIMPQQFFAEEWDNQTVKTLGKVYDERAKDNDGSMIWCQFTRPLSGPSDGKMADLTQSLFQTVIIGALNETTKSPFLPPLEAVNFVTETWNHNHTIEVMHLIGVNSIDKIEATIFSMLMSTLLVLLLSHI